MAVVWPEIPHFTIYKVADWSVVDSGSAKYFAWDTCKERYALLETTVVPRLPLVTKGRKAKEAAAQAAAAAAAASSSSSAIANISGSRPSLFSSSSSTRRIFLAGNPVKINSSVSQKGKSLTFLELLAITLIPNWKTQKSNR